jgi:hypothetical protein
MVCVGLTALGADAFGQKKGDASDEAARLTGKSERRLDSISFRMTLKTEWFAEQDGLVERESLETFATVQPNRYHSISETGSTRIETIVVGDKTFRRTNDSDWESVAVPPIRKFGDASTVAFFGELAGGAALPQGKGKFVAKGTIDGEEVSMYEVRTVRQDNTPERSVRTETTTYWINNDGLIVRRIIEHAFSGDKRVMRSTADYTYTDISVDEPILPAKVQD